MKCIFRNFLKSPRTTEGRTVKRRWPAQETHRCRRMRGDAGIRGTLGIISPQPAENGACSDFSVGLASLSTQNASGSIFAEEGSARPTTSLR